MRFVFCFVLGLILSVQGLALPTLTGQVVDEANILSAENRNNIIQLLQAEKMDNVIVVTVADLQGKKLKAYIADLAKAWGLGQEAYDNGVILAIGPGMVRIAVGKSMEDLLPAEKSYEIIDKGMKPLLMKGDAGGAAIVGTKGIIAAVNGRKVVEPEETPSTGNWLWWILGIVVVAGALFYLVQGNSKTEE